MASGQDAGLVKVHYAALQNAASQLQGLYDTLFQINADVMRRTEAAASTAVWGGTAAQTFAVRMNETAQTVQTTLNQLHAAADAMPSLISAIQEAETQGGALFATST